MYGGGFVSQRTTVTVYDCHSYPSAHAAAMRRRLRHPPLGCTCGATAQAVSIHGDISQQQRTDAVEKFKSGAVPLLIATDVAARGLDIPDVEVRRAGWGPGGGCAMWL
jgi:hypothetical protein